jgi:phosphatidylserine/phosphatidylglycerophosphate/cardiolipin synthase-like enzyme
VKKTAFILCMVVSMFIGGCLSHSFIETPTSANGMGVRSSKPILVEDPVSNLNLSYAFTQAHDHPEVILVNVIAETKSTLDIAIYSLTHPDIIQAISDAKKRGVTVRIISVKLKLRTRPRTLALSNLKATGVPIKINTHSGLMHLKVTIVDKKILTSGSFNYSKAASTTNDEVLIVDRDPIAAVKWDQEFNVMWNDTKKFSDVVP